MKVVRATYPLFLLLLTAQTSAVKITSNPEVNADGVLQAHLNDTVSLICDINDPNLEDKELNWQRNGATVKLKDENKNSRSSLCISPLIAEDDAATFTCSLKKNSSVSASVTLDVVFPPQLFGFEEISLEKDEDLVLECNMLANPLITSVLWTLNGSTVDLVAGGVIVINDGTTTRLQINNVDPELHDGTYKCSLTSPMFPVHSKEFLVTVTERTLKFPLMPLIAGLVVVFITSILAVVSRWKKIAKCCKRCTK